MDRHSTLEKLENSVWADPDFDSHLVRRCHQLRKVPLDKLTVEDLRILIGQQIGLKFLVDLAIEKLTADILAEGDFYPGDLLKSVIDIDKKYWDNSKDQKTTITNLINQNLDKVKDAGIEINMF
jgi:CDI immunity proteins